MSTNGPRTGTARARGFFRPTAPVMGLDLARHRGVTLVGRAKHGRFLVFSGSERIEFNQ